MLTNWANIATIIGTGVAIIAVILTVWFFFRSRQRRALSYAFETSEPLSIDSGSSVKNDLQIFYDGNLVESLYVIRVGIKNTGGADSSIKRSDFIDPIKFIFSPGTKILRERIIKSTPDNIKVEISLESSNQDGIHDIANLTFDLLNSSWEIIIEFIFSTPKGTLASLEIIPKIDKIPAMGHYTFHRPSNRFRRITYVIFGLLTCIFAFISGLLDGASDSGLINTPIPNTLFRGLFFGTMIVGLILIIYSIFIDRSESSS